MHVLHIFSFIFAQKSAMKSIFAVITVALVLCVVVHATTVDKAPKHEHANPVHTRIVAFCSILLHFVVLLFSVLLRLFSAFFVHFSAFELVFSFVSFRVRFTFRLCSTLQRSRKRATNTNTRALRAWSTSRATQPSTRYTHMCCVDFCLFLCLFFGVCLFICFRVHFFITLHTHRAPALPLHCACRPMST